MEPFRKINSLFGPGKRGSKRTKSCLFLTFMASSVQKSAYAENVSKTGFCAKIHFGTHFNWEVCWVKSRCGRSRKRSREGIRNECVKPHQEKSPAATLIYSAKLKGRRSRKLNSVPHPAICVPQISTHKRLVEFCNSFASINESLVWPKSLL